jgi:hypothetical protein
MRIFLICSKKFYDKIPNIKLRLEKKGHKVTLPNCYDDPFLEDKYRDLGNNEHSKWKAEMIKHSTEVISKQDAVFVINFEKNGIKNYIGGATFLEMYDAFRLGKKIYLYNDVPEGILRDEIIGFSPIVIESNLNII